MNKNTLQYYIDLGWYTVPLEGQLKRTDNGKKTIPTFRKNWLDFYSNNKNKTDKNLGGLITGKLSNIIAIDCDNAITWQLFRQLDPEYSCYFKSIGKGEEAGTILYAYTEDINTTFRLHNSIMSVDIYSNDGFIYLPTVDNYTKQEAISLNIKHMPVSVLALLSSLKAPVAPTETKISNFNYNCLNPVVKQLVLNKKFIPNLFKVITPKDFRSEPEYLKKGYLHPDNVPQGRGSEYLSKVSSILGSDISIDKELYVEAMHIINSLFSSPMPEDRLDATILEPMITGKANINNEQIWKYSEDWASNKIILTSKRNVPIEVVFDDIRNIYYVVDTINQRHISFSRDSELQSYLEASVAVCPKKSEIKPMLPIISTCQYPNKPFGFIDKSDHIRLFNTFRQTSELLIFNDPTIYKSLYKPPNTILKYLSSLIPDEDMRSYLLRFIKTKLTTFNYSPVVLYFIGVHGSGKDLFVNILETILGRVARPTTKEFLEVYNGWLLDTYFVQLDEYGNQLVSYSQKEEALGKIKAYTGKSKVQIRAMRNDGFAYDHYATFIITANKNPLMLEDGDRRIAFFHTPNVLSDQDWVVSAGGISQVYEHIIAEIKDFCYYLSTEVSLCDGNEYVKPPSSVNKHELIASSMKAGPSIIYAIKYKLKNYLVKLALDNDLTELKHKILTNNFLISDLDDLYLELTDYNGDTKKFHRSIRSNGVELIPTNKNGERHYKINLGDNPFEEQE